jgi:hypothetical protein
MLKFGDQYFWRQQPVLGGYPEYPNTRLRYHPWYPLDMILDDIFWLISNLSDITYVISCFLISEVYVRYEDLDIHAGYQIQAWIRISSW